MDRNDRASDREVDEVKWLAMLIRQGLKLIVAGIERRYRLGPHKPKRDTVSTLR